MTEEDDLSELINSNRDILDLEFSDFVDKWGEREVTVPVSLINFYGLIEHIHSKRPELLELNHIDENKEELEEVLGELTEPFIDFVFSDERAGIKQRLNALEKKGYVDIYLDENGVTIMEPTEKAEGEILEGICALIKAYRGIIE